VVPPQLDGGTERVVSFLTEGLVKQGHEVTLFGSGDSQSAATLVPMCQTALRLQGEQVVDPIAYHTRMMELVSQQAPEFEILHFHTDYLQSSSFPCCGGSPFQPLRRTWPTGYGRSQNAFLRILGYESGLDLKRPASAIEGKQIGWATFITDYQ
jgi:hypothetical protein